MKRTIITIGRQYASGGRLIGKKLSKLMGIPYYDKELLVKAAEDSGYSQNLFSNADEKPVSSLLYSLVMGNYPISKGTMGYNELPLNDQLFLIMSNTIKKIAEEGSAIIIGRCADYVLREDPDLLSIFIHAPIEARVKKVIADGAGNDDNAESLCLKYDKSRANFYNYYSDNKWGVAKGYDLSIDSSVLGYDGTAELIKTFAELKEKTQA